MEVHHHSHTESPPAGRTGKKFTHYLWEFLMLFLAVFCGFLAENFREHIVEKRREKQFMISLLTDLKTDTSTFKRVIISYTNSNKRMDSLIALLKSPERNKWTNDIYYFVKTVFLGIQYNTANKTYEQMKSSGNLRLVHSSDLLDSLGSYYYDFSNLEKFGPPHMLFETRHDLFISYNKLFDASVFQKMISPPDSSNIIIRPEGNPPLLTNDPAIINEICLRIHNMYFAKRVAIGQARRNIERATYMIKKIEEEYDLK